MRRRLRYLLTHDPALAVWETPRSDLCGLASWRDAAAAAAPLPAGAADQALREPCPAHGESTRLPAASWRTSSHRLDGRWLSRPW